MLEQELVDLTENAQSGGRISRRDGGQGWSVMTPVWDSRGRRLLGYVRMESSGGLDGNDVVTELEETLFAG